MLRPIFLFAIFLTAISSGYGQAESISEWTKLIRANNCGQAKQLCAKFVDSSNATERAEAQKCLANVALCGHDVVQLQGDDAGGGTMMGGFTSEAVDEALVHLNQGIQVAPQDLSIHMGRLHILEVSGRYSEMVKALDESCTIYRGSGGVQNWLDYSVELMDLRQYEAGLAFMKVLEKHYLDSPDVLGNIGAFLNLLKKTSESIPYLQRAVQLAPNDPINAWDLGRAYDYDGKIELADAWYQKGISLDSDTERHKRSSCLYAIFVETKLHDRARACSMERKDCAVEEQTACSSAPDPKDQAK
jgi:tetratricopeptide (TPR) repeat protein